MGSKASNAEQAELQELRARVVDLERYEAAVQVLASDMERDGVALLRDIQGGDRLALARRFRSILKAKLVAQAQLAAQSASSAGG